MVYSSSKATIIVFSLHHIYSCHTKRTLWHRAAYYAAAICRTNPVERNFFTFIYTYMAANFKWTILTWHGRRHRYSHRQTQKLILTGRIICVSSFFFILSVRVLAQVRWSVTEFWFDAATTEPYIYIGKRIACIWMWILCNADAVRCSIASGIILWSISWNDCNILQHVIVGDDISPINI